MGSQRVVVVVGATGMQGGGLAKAILTDPHSEFTVRAITRNPDSDAARALYASGADVVQADLNDESSVQAAFEGADCAFLVTNWLELMSPELEIEQAHTMARAALHAGVGHVIWSTFEDSRDFISPDDPKYPDVLGYKVPHIDAKASANSYFTEIGVPTTFLRTAFFWDNFLAMVSLQRDDEGRVTLPLAMADNVIPGIAGEDIGPVALGILKNRDAFLGRTVSIAGEHLTGAEIVRHLSVVLNEPVSYQPVPIAMIRQGDFPLADDVANMFQFFIDHDQALVDARDVAFCRELHPDLKSFAQWAHQNEPRLRATADGEG